MKKHHKSVLSVMLPGFLLMFGCTTNPTQQTHFYRLNTQHETPRQDSEPRRESLLQPRIGLSSVRLASYLDRPQIINRVSPYRLELQDFHHWAGKLQENITLVLVDSLQASLGEDTVIGSPWHRSIKPAYELALYVSRLDEENGQVLLQARWTLIEEQEGRLIELQQAHISEPVQDSGPEAVVAAASRALQQLAMELSRRLKPYL